MAFYCIAQLISSRVNAAWFDIPRNDYSASSIGDTDLARVALRIHIRIFPQKKVDDRIALAIFKTGGNHQRSPTRRVL